MKSTVEACLSLDVNALVRAGLFRAPAGTPCNVIWKDSSDREIFRINFRWDGPSIRLTHWGNGSALMPVSYRIELTSLPCHLGGARRLFRCPGGNNGIRCGRRAAKLYLIGEAWVCRTCGDLTYLARQQHDKRKDRLLKDPLALLEALENGDYRQQLLALGAYRQAVARLTKLARRDP